MEPHQNAPDVAGAGGPCAVAVANCRQRLAQLSRLPTRLARVARRGPWSGSREASAPTRQCDAPCHALMHAAPMLRHRATLPGDRARRQSPVAPHIQAVGLPKLPTNEQMRRWQDVRQQCGTESGDPSAAAGEQVVLEMISQEASCKPIYRHSILKQRSEHNQTCNRNNPSYGPITRCSTA